MTSSNIGSQPRRVAFVAGASSGLGAAIAQALAGSGMDVALAARRVEVVESAAAHLGELFGGRALGVALDLQKAGSAPRAVSAAVDALGAIDVLVLNGGGPPPGDAASLDSATARAAAELLLYGHLDLVNATLPSMRQRGWGRIVAIGSSAVQQPIPGLATSGMFRSALATYLKLLAAEVAADGVTVNMVVPGRIATDRVARLDAARAKRTGQPVEQVREASLATIPARRYGEPEELAAVVAFLAAPSASYVTGEQIRVDGGLVAAP